MQDLPNGGGAHPEPCRSMWRGGGGADPSIGPRALETLGKPLHGEAPWGWPSRGGAVLYWLSPQLGEDPPCWGPGVMWSSGRIGVAQLVARSTPDWCVVGWSPTCGTEHFGFLPSAPRLGNQRPWYVQPRLCDWAYKRSRATYRNEKGIVSRWSVSS